MSLLLSIATSLAACPLPLVLADGLTPDGGAHLLARSATEACWWIVDDQGDARVGARWDLSRREPVALVVLADGRAVTVLREATEPTRWRLGVRAEGSPERRLDLDLPGAPATMRALSDSAVLIIEWEDTLEKWLVDVDSGGLVRATPVSPQGGDELAGLRR